MDFDWDEAKRAANIAKHGVDFLRATLIFDGPILEMIDEREDYGEERMIALGLAVGTVYRVVYTIRQPASASSVPGSRCFTDRRLH